MRFRDRKKEMAGIVIGVAAIAVFNAGALAATTGSVTISGTTSGSYSAGFTNITFTAATLGTTTSGTSTITTADTSGTNAGWNITMNATAFYDSTSATYLGTSSTTANDTLTLNAYPSLTGSGCTAPTNTGTGAVSYPVTVPQEPDTSSTAVPTAGVVMIAAASSGEGSCSGTGTFDLVIPANATPETTAYTSTLTSTIASGP